MSEELLHFSAREVTTIKQASQQAAPTMKPNGFWLSIGLEWAEWCRAEDFAPGGFRFITRVGLHSNANVLRALLQFGRNSQNRV